MPNAESPSEHHLRFHRRQWIIYLLGCTTMAAGTIVMVLAPGMNSAAMSSTTVALGCGVWAAAYLYHTRPSPDE
jgi:hypothetical protein